MKQLDMAISAWQWQRTSLCLIEPIFRSSSFEHSRSSRLESVAELIPSGPGEHSLVSLRLDRVPSHAQEQQADRTVRAQQQHEERVEQGRGHHQYVLCPVPVVGLHYSSVFRYLCSSSSRYLATSSVP